MRSIHRDRREITYANITGTKPIFDEYGNDTLEVETVYEEPVAIKVSVSSNAGEESVNVFGVQTEYSRVLSFTGACPLKEGAKVWFGQHEYVVARIADSKNGILVALREVSGNG